jgi:hypothetical protein
MVGQVSLSIAYGIETAPLNDPHIALADAALQGVSVAQTKGRIFNLVPFRKPNSLRLGCSPVILTELSPVIHLPWWFPGAGFKKEAGTWKHKMNRCRDEVFGIVKKKLVRIVPHISLVRAFFKGVSGGKQRSAFSRRINDHRSFRRLK